ncbi:MAG: Hsp70 family protein, partial [Candidatus Latescibacterota bacterium]
HVSARDLGTGKAQEIVIKQSGGLTSAEIDRMVEEAESFAEEDRERKAYSQASNDALTLLYSTEQTIEEYGERFSPDELARIKAAMNVLNDVKDKGPQAMEDLREATDRLQAIMHRFAELMYTAPE